MAKMTKNDKALVLSIYGGDENTMKDDLGQINCAFETAKFYTWGVNRKGEEVQKYMSANKARMLLGDEMFVSGLVRAAFHWTASRLAKDGTPIFIDCKRMFRAA